ncbi:MAG: hypothetical protein KDC44_15435, partial [Phaeodactylibacter sp.]|nr:hypothetical protein [Phaeodactylibacter sp.]
MTEATNKYQSIFGFGTTQNSRLPKALLPDSIHIEGKDLAKLMAYSVDYAKKLRFFNESNVQDGTWEPFLNTDVSFILANIVSQDLERINEEFGSQVEAVLQNHQFAEKSLALEGAFRYIHGLIARFNTWYQQIHAISLPNSELEYNVELELVSIIDGQLREDLQKLKSYDLGAAAKDALGEAVGLDYSSFEPIWYLEAVEAVNIFIGDKPNDRVSRALISLRLLYRSVYNALNYAQHNFRPLFEQSIRQKSDHKPDTGLLITFLQLYQHAQRDLNQVSINYLRFYYEHFLQLRPQGCVPDEVHLSLEVAGHLDRHVVPAGTRLLAGQDADGNDIRFETTHELEVNSASLESIRTIYLSKYNQPEVTSFEVITGMYAAPQANSRDGKGRPFEDPHESWPTFGEEQALKPSDADTMANADIGFAISAPILRMKEGHRKVTMTLFFDPESIQIFKKLLLDIRQN